MMKYLKRVLLFIVAVVVLYGVGRLGVVTYDSYRFVERQPYMVLQTQDSLTIKWQTPKKEIGKVQYGFFQDTLNNSLSEEKATDKHQIQIQGLKECTKYFYSVSSESMDIDNTNRSFTTLCKNADAQKIWVIGDSGKKGKAQTQVYEQMLKSIDNDFNQLDMWILLGDNAYRSGTQKQYNKAMFEPYKELVKRFAPVVVYGNHDARRWAFFEIFDFPAEGQSGGLRSDSQNYYAIDNGNIHFVVLDSEDTDRSADGAMAQWLKKDLQANKKPWTIVLFHTPPYSDGGHKSDSAYDSGGRLKDMRENFVPIFDAYGVDLVLSGHSHDYERSKLLINHTGTSKTFDPKKHIVQDKGSCYTKPYKAGQNSGTVYQVCGSSSKLDHADLKHPALAFSFEKMGSLVLDVTPTTLHSKFLTIDGTIADEFTIRKDTSTCQKGTK